MQNRACLCSSLITVMIGTGWTRQRPGRRPWAPRSDEPGAGYHADSESCCARLSRTGQSSAAGNGEPALIKFGPAGVRAWDRTSRIFFSRACKSANHSTPTQLANFSNPKARSVTRLLGSLAMQRIWNRYDAGLDYVGGAGFYTSGMGTRQIHSLDAYGRSVWRNGQLTLRDSFSYLPDGTFGFGSYGGIGGFPFGAALGGPVGVAGLGGFGGQLHFFGAGQLGTLGNEPHITNLATVDIAQHLTPRSTVTLTGGYGIGHFTDNSDGLIDSRQTAVQAGYNYILSRKDQIGVLYGYQKFQFPGGGGATFDTHLAHFLYGRAISGRLSFGLLRVLSIPS